MPAPADGPISANVFPTAPTDSVNWPETENEEDRDLAEVGRCSAGADQRAKMARKGGRAREGVGGLLGRARGEAIENRE